MMHRCSSSHWNMIEACTCGSFHNQSNSSCMLFSIANNKPYDESDMYYCYTPSSTSVDCTLSLETHQLDSLKRKRDVAVLINVALGTVSPTFAGIYFNPKTLRIHSSKVSLVLVPTVVIPTMTPSSLVVVQTATPRQLPFGGMVQEAQSHCAMHEELDLKRRSEELVLQELQWRIMLHRLQTAGNIVEFRTQNSYWYSHAKNQKMPCLSPATGNEFHFINDSDRDPDNGTSFLSWRLNVSDRPNLVDDFTR